MKSLAISAMVFTLLSTTATTLLANGPMGNSANATSGSRNVSPPSGQRTKPVGRVSYAKGAGPDVWDRAIRDERRRNTRGSLERARIGADIRHGLHGHDHRPQVTPTHVYHTVRTVHNPSYPVYQVIGRTLLNSTLPIYSVGSDPNYQRQAVEAYGHLSGHGRVGGVSLRDAMDDY